MKSTDKIDKHKIAIVKFNGGNPVLLCSNCRKVVKNWKRFYYTRNTIC